MRRCRCRCRLLHSVFSVSSISKKEGRRTINGVRRRRVKHARAQPVGETERAPHPPSTPSTRSPSRKMELTAAAAASQAQSQIRHPSVTVTSQLIFIHQCRPERLRGAMLNLAGESRRRYRPFLPSPSSSPEDFSSPIAAAPSPPSRVARNASPGHPAKQLHTSASSVDIPSFPPSIHDSLTGPQDPDSSVNNTSLLEVQIQKLLDQIEGAKASDAESLACLYSWPRIYAHLAQELPISPEVWLGLSEKIPEDLGGRSVLSTPVPGLGSFFPCTEFNIRAAR